MEDIAWDFIAWTPEWEALAEKTDAVCFSSLAQRSASSHLTIHKLLAAARAKATLVFDVNLRQLFFSQEVLEESITLADVVKLNHEELPRVAQLFGAPVSGEVVCAQWLCRNYDLKLVCGTRGAKGTCWSVRMLCTKLRAFRQLLRIPWERAMRLRPDSFTIFCAGRHLP
jgi:fructokinase